MRDLSKSPSTVMPIQSVRQALQPDPKDSVSPFYINCQFKGHTLFCSKEPQLIISFYWIFQNVTVAAVAEQNSTLVTANGHDSS